MSIASDLAEWAWRLEPNAEDLALADRALLDTVAVSVAAAGDQVLARASSLDEAGRWAVAAHVLDFDDLHMGSTAHISAVCVPATLAVGGDARVYLASAGVMARLGNALGWSHYAAGWHATCTTGPPAVAAGVAAAWGLEVPQIANAIALAIPAAGGNQRAFGNDSKSLQVGMATDAGIRAARLAAAGAQANLDAVEEWMRLVSAESDQVDLSGPAVPGGLAIKMSPCCYAMQRPIAAVRSAMGDGLDTTVVDRVVLTTAEATVKPLIHHDPSTGLESKFSLEYAVATALLDAHSGFESFSDLGIQRAEARRITDLVSIELVPGGTGLLTGDCAVSIELKDGRKLTSRVELPPGAPGMPPTAAQMQGKIDDCWRKSPEAFREVSWKEAGAVLRRLL